MKKIVGLFLLAFLGFSTQLMAQKNLEEKLASLGISKEDCHDWSDSANITLPLPTCAYVNVTNIPKMPTKWGVNYHGWVELYDGNGNYFRKRAIVDLQGRGTTKFPEKNFKVAFCNDEWLEEETPDIKFGNWVTQDSYHFKAFYNDIFRGTGIICYRVYDLITSPRGEYGRVWERANIKKPDPEALCHPDAFPCLVYLNGKYWGLYSLQLKKHRKNMNMKKNTPEHIHLDGSPRILDMLNGEEDWKGYEIRNPKNLYKMNGNPYNGDGRGELIDETSEFFDLETDDEDTRKYKQNSVIVKGYIEQLRHYVYELEDMRKNKATKEEMRAAIEERFDVPSLCDYIIHNLLTNNADGLGRNLQMITYDGKKWFIVPYDLDATFGYNPVCRILFPAKNYGLGRLTARSFLTYGALRWADMYYRPEIYAHYAYLRNNGILTAESVSSLFTNWYYDIGEDNYQDEWLKWPASPCLLPDIVNEPWRKLDFSEYEYADYKSTAHYNSATTYKPGDRCKEQYRLWEAKETTTGVYPYEQVGLLDSIGRIEPWVREHLLYLDQWMHYSFESLPLSYNMQISSAGWSTICVPFQFDVPKGVTLYTVKGHNEKGELITEEVKSPEANKPYLVKGPLGLYLLSGYTEETNEMADDYLVNGAMKGCFAERYVPKGAYVLQNQDGKIGFYRVERDGQVKMGRYRAYLHFDSADAAPSMIGVDTMDNTTSISLTETAPGIVGVYDINGSSIDKMRKGVNVVKYSDGTTKKIIIK